MSRHILTRDGAVVYDYTDGAVVTPPPVTPAPTPPPAGPTPPPANAREIPFPGFGPHPVIKLEANVPYFMRIPYATSLMAVQIAGTFEDSVTDVEVTGSPTPGDRNWCNTPEAAYTPKPGERGVATKPAYWRGSSHGGGGRLGWSPTGSASDFKRPNDGRGWCINFFTPQSEKKLEFYVMGG